MESATCNNERHAFLHILCFTRERDGKWNIEIMQSDAVSYIAIVTSQESSMFVVLSGLNCYRWRLAKDA